MRCTGPSVESCTKLPGENSSDDRPDSQQRPPWVGPHEMVQRASSEFQTGPWTRCRATSMSTEWPAWSTAGSQRRLPLICLGGQSNRAKPGGPSDAGWLADGLPAVGLAMALPERLPGAPIGGLSGDNKSGLIEYPVAQARAPCRADHPGKSGQSNTSSYFLKSKSTSGRETGQKINHFPGQSAGAMSPKCGDSGQIERPRQRRHQHASSLTGNRRIIMEMA